jgi:hypothetical protein
MLADAQVMFDGGRLRSAGDRAYYAIFHASQAALLAIGKKPTRSHRGLRSQFGRHLIISGLLERELGRTLTFAHQVRQESTYEAYADADPTEVSTLLNRAREFCDRIRRFVGENQ